MNPLGGGPDGNEQLTAATGVVLIVLLAALGVTILRIGQLTWLHFFLGLLLIGPVMLKLASTGYRFTQAGGIGRAIALLGAIVAGVVLAIALTSDFSIWTAHLALLGQH